MIIVQEQKFFKKTHFLIYNWRKSSCTKTMRIFVLWFRSIFESSSVYTFHVNTFWLYLLKTFLFLECIIFVNITDMKANCSDWNIKSVRNKFIEIRQWELNFLLSWNNKLRLSWAKLSLNWICSWAEVRCFIVTKVIRFIFKILDG